MMKVKKPQMIYPTVNKEQVEDNKMKAIEATKELITGGKIPVEKLEETMEKILGITIDKEDRKEMKSEESYNQGEND